MYNQKDKRERHKGESILYVPDKYIVIDLETTGLNPEHDEIIEIGAVKVQDNNIIDEFSSLIQPNSFVDDFITQLTGITNDMLKPAPLLKDILPTFKDFIEYDILAGHNVHFDINFLYDNFEKYNNHILDNNILDLLRISRAVLPDLNNHKLVTLAKQFDIETKGHHRALNDCYITYKCIKNINQYAFDNNIDMNNTSYYKTAFKPRQKLSELTPECTSFNEDNIFYNKKIVFTGELKYYPRKEAAQIVVNLGAQAQNNVTKNTDVLVMGSYKGIRNIKGNKTGKQKRAEKLILEGQEIDIMDEETFYEMIDNEEILEGENV